MDTPFFDFAKSFPKGTDGHYILMEYALKIKKPYQFALAQLYKELINMGAINPLATGDHHIEHK